MTNATNNNAPIQSFRIGSVRAAVWAKQGENGTFHSVTITRTYKDGETYKDTNSYSHLELLAVARVAEQAARYIETLEAA